MSSCSSGNKKTTIEKARHMSSIHHSIGFNVTMQKIKYATKGCKVKLEAQAVWRKSYAGRTALTVKKKRNSFQNSQSSSIIILLVC